MRLCKIDGCGKKHEAHGWCKKHYLRWWRYGDPLAGAPFRREQGEALRYLHDVVMNYDGADCLFWPAGRNQIWREGSMHRVTRVVCELAHGPAPSPDHEAAHACGNGDLVCVTKRHLRWATHPENCSDKVLHGTAQRGERHSMAKLDRGAVQRIRGITGQTHAKIAEQFGVCPATISHIRNRRNWHWLPDGEESERARHG